MQNAADCNGSSNSNNVSNNSITTTIIATTTTSSSGSSSHSAATAAAAICDASSTTTVTLTPAQQPTNLLRQRLPARINTATILTVTPATSATTTTNFNYNAAAAVNTHRNGSAHLIDAVTYLGSKVEQITTTPTPSPSHTPQASPAKRCKQTAAVTAITSTCAAAATAAATSTSTLDTLVAANTLTTNISSNSSSNSNSNSNSTTSSVIATPTLARNSNTAYMQQIEHYKLNNSKSASAATAVAAATVAEMDLGLGSIISSAGVSSTSINIGLRRSIERNELLATKTLPLPPTTITTSLLNASNDDNGCFNEMSTPMTPSSFSSQQTASLTSSPASASASVSASVSASASAPASASASTTTTSSATPASNITTPATSPSKSPSMDAQQLLQWKDMPQYLQFNPYVLQGYRPLQTFKGCLFSLFYWHNETINILTHAIPIVYILAIVPGLMPWEKEYRFLSFCHLFGSVAPWCGSFVYHLFMNIEKGENVYYRLLKLDMVGIWVSQSFGALPLVTATTFCFSYKWKWFIILAYCVLSLWGLYKALTASSPWQRRLCFALPFTMRSILTFLRTRGLVGGNRVALSHVYLQLQVDGVSILGGAIGAMRIPEKWFPGLVDFYLNSHNIMHVLVVLAVYSMHQATIKDFEWMSSTNCENYTMASSSEEIENNLNTNIEL